MNLVKVRIPRTNQPKEFCGPSDIVPAGSLLLMPSSDFPVVGTISKGANQVGQTLSAANSGSYINPGRVFQAQPGAATWVMVFTAGTATGFIGGTVNNGTSYYEGITLNVDAGANALPASGNLGLYIRDNAGIYRHGMASGVFNATTPVCVVIQFADPNTFQIWVDGVERSVTYGFFGSPVPTNALTELGYDVLNRNSRGSHTAGDSATKLSLFARMPSLLADPAGISANPWQLFEPEEVTIWIPEESTGVTLNPPLLTNTNTLLAPTLSAGAVSLAAPLLTNASSLIAPLVTRGAVNLSAPLIASVNTLFAPTVVAGGSISVPLLGSTTQLYAPTVTRGAVGISAPLLVNGSSLYSPTVTKGQSLSAPTLASTLQMFAPTVNPGAVAVGVPLLPSSNTFFAPMVSGGDVVTAGALAGGRPGRYAMTSRPSRLQGARPSR